MLRLSRVLLVSLALAGVAEAQNPPYWGQDNCLYSWDGRAYSTALCRVVAAPYVSDYWNPQTQQWLLRIDDNPANRHIDYVYLQGPGRGGGVRVARARPGEAVPVAPIAFKTPNGPWTATAEGTAWAEGPNARTNSPTMAGCPEWTPPSGRAMSPEEKRCFDARSAMLTGVLISNQIRNSCQERAAAGPYAGMTAQQKQDAVREGRLADGWVQTHLGPVPRGC